MSWYHRVGSRTTGPHTLAELIEKRKRRELAPTHQVSGDSQRWISAVPLCKQIDEILGGGSSGDEWNRPQPQPQPSPRPDAATWYYTDRAHQKAGPVPEAVLREMLRTRMLPRTTLVCQAEGDWIAARLHPTFRADVPAGPSPRVIAASAAAAAVLGLLALLVVRPGALRGVGGGGSGGGGGLSTSATSPGSSAGSITSLDDENRLEQAVGFVVCGWLVHWKNGTVEEVQESSGSCFAVTSDGYLVSNDHVVRRVAPRFRMTPENRVIDYCAIRIARFEKKKQELQQAGQPIPARFEELLAAIYRKFNPDRIQAVEPRIWVFFGSKEEVYEARIVHQSGFDMSVLKINRANAPYLRIAGDDRYPKVRDDVFVLGFPGVAQTALNEQEEKARELREEQNQGNVAEQFRPEDFRMSTTKGIVGRYIDSPETGKRIQIDAVINNGNSGGPLVLPDSTAIGINTWGLDGKVYWSLAMPPLMKEIARAIEKDRSRPAAGASASATPAS